METNNRHLIRHLRNGGADAYLRHCPSRTVLEVLSDKWTLLVICRLADGPRRFGELRRGIDGVTQKMLTQTLRSLERDGLVVRTVFATAPPSVEYALTDLGTSSTRLLDDIRRWSETHVLQVLASREKYDRRCAAPQSGLPPTRVVAGVRKRTTGAAAR
jgi:DNA-binding HxlR family transcriptional regulator